MSVSFSIQLLYLLGQRPLLVFEISAAALILIQRDHPAQVGVGEPLQLLLEAGAALAQIIAPRLQFLWQLGTTMCSVECVLNELRML